MRLDAVLRLLAGGLVIWCLTDDLAADLVSALEGPRVRSTARGVAPQASVSLVRDVRVFAVLRWQASVSLVREG